MRFVGVPDALRFPNDVALWLQHMHEHPILAHMQTTGDGSTHKISDFLPQRQFHRSALYNEVYQHIHGEHQMSITLELSSPQLVTFVFNRARKDFSEPDRQLLNILRSSLMQAYLQTEAVAQMRHDMAMLQLVFDALDCGMVVLTMAGRVQLMTSQAQRWQSSGAIFALPC